MRCIELFFKQSYDVSGHQTVCYQGIKLVNEIKSGRPFCCLEMATDQIH